MMNQFQSNADTLGADPAVKTYGHFNSPSMYQQAVQFRVNGKNKTPRDGITKPNQRLALLTDTYGDCAAVPFQNYSRAADENYFRIAALDEQDDGNSYHCLYDITSLHIGERIEDLQVEHKRTGLANGDDDLDSNKPLNVLVMAEVKKAMSFANGSYDISYV